MLKYAQNKIHKTIYFEKVKHVAEDKASII